MTDRKAPDIHAVATKIGNALRQLDDDEQRIRVLKHAAMLYRHEVVPFEEIVKLRSPA